MHECLHFPLIAMEVLPVAPHSTLRQKIDQDESPDRQKAAIQSYQYKKCNFSISLCETGGAQGENFTSS